MPAKKIYVEVVARFDPQGQITPLSLRWFDGTVYEIDRILDTRRSRFAEGRRHRDPLYLPDLRATALSVF